MQHVCDCWIPVRNPCISKHFRSLPHIKIIISHLYQLTGNVHLQITLEKTYKKHQLISNRQLTYVTAHLVHQLYNVFCLVQFRSLLDSLIFSTGCPYLQSSHHVDDPRHQHVWLRHAAQGLPPCHSHHVLYHIMLALRQSSWQEQHTDVHFDTNQQHTSAASPCTVQQMISTTHSFVM